RRRRLSKDERILIFRSAAASGVILRAGLTFVQQAHAQSSFKAEYVISFARITVGGAIIRADIGGNAYAISASGHAGGVMSLLADGDGNLASRGFVPGNRLLSSKFMLKINSANDPLDVNIAIEDGNVRSSLFCLPAALTARR